MSKIAEQYSDLDKLRHSCSHVLAQAVKRKFPKAKLGFGPPVEEGFYYDIALEHALTDEDLREIEKEMAKIVQADYKFEKTNVSADEARKVFKDKDETFKLEVVNSLDGKEQLSLVTDGDFTDLCKYPHAEATGLIKAFALTSIAGAYWKGVETNPVMQRIYGTAFFSQAELDENLKMREEAKKRDHRKLGVELDFFSIKEEAGQGLIFWHPKGAFVRYLIEQFMREEHLKRDYKFVIGPQILKRDVWKISGHYSYYKENMFIFQTEDEKEYALKPMNCPGHMMIFRTTTRSYRELPLRFFEMGNVCRNEKSGVLHGLLRVRNFTQDDAHIFCLPDQLEGEIASVIDFVFFVLKTFGFEKFEIELSTRPKESIGTEEIWEKATSALRNALEKKGLAYEVGHEGGAFYGPKIDVRIKDALGRSWQCSTIQCDFALPEKFELEYISSAGKKERPVMLHRAILGSVERFMGCLIEHYSGALPLWLSPVQAVLIPIADTHETYCQEWKNRLEKQGIRAEVLPFGDTLGKRIQRAQAEKVPYMLVAGNKEIEARTWSVRKRGSKDQETLDAEEFSRRLESEIAAKR